MVQWLRRPFDHLQLERLVLSSIPNEGIFFFFSFLCFSFLFSFLSSFFLFFIIFVISESNELYSSFALLSLYQKLFFLQFIIVTHHSITCVQRLMSKTNVVMEIIQGSIIIRLQIKYNGVAITS